MIQTPSANSRDEGTISFTFNKNDMWKMGTLSVSPFNWLEASYFYYRPSDLIWTGTNVPGHYLDKGFNVKFKYSPRNRNRPDLAIGLDDFAGTGYLTREYLVATQELRDLKVSFGLGWGKFTGSNSFNNPLSFFSDAFKVRPDRSSNYNLGGTPSYDKWFRGSANLFGGIEYFVPGKQKLSFKLEHDPFNYFDFTANNRPDATYKLRKKDSNTNIGINYKFNNFLTLSASYLKGNTFNISFTIGATFNEKIRKKPIFNPSIIHKNKNKNNKKLAFYEDLLINLSNNNLLLQTANISKKKLDISIATSEHRNAIRSSSYTASVAKKVLENHDVDVNLVNISHINVGIELNNITYIEDYIDDDTPIELIKRNTTFNSGDPNGYLQDEFKPNVNFPAIFSTFSPEVLTHIGAPEKFYFGGLNIKNVSEIQFSRNLILTSEINARIYDNFRNTVAGADSVMEHVRTDLVQYLKEDDIYITRMQLDYIWSPYKEVYAKVSGGIYETMFAGIGIEALYKPFNNNFSIGANIFQVKQRAYDQKFGFRNYKTSTGHVSFGYELPFGIYSDLSFGRYLAKDDGFTYDLSRTTPSGLKAGIYFTRTDIPAEIFGEGSFDKGFYFQIPMDFLTNGYSSNYFSFKLSPLTRDGGAKLNNGMDLRGIIYNSSSNEISKQWKGYHN